jgi:hypothetical protein
MDGDTMKMLDVAADIIEDNLPGRYNKLVSDMRVRAGEIGDSIDRFDRDPDAFTAGVQHALDKMTATIDRLLMDPHTSEYLIGTAANILANVHDGTM